MNVKDLVETDPCPLYSVKPRTYVNWLDQIFFFDHIDGMYSYCTATDGRVVHIGAAAIVKPLVKQEEL